MKHAFHNETSGPDAFSLERIRMTKKSVKKSREMILIADDDPTIVKSLEAAVRKAGYSVLTCGSLANCLEVVRSGDVELLLLDVQFPEGSSLEILEEIATGSAGTRTIMITASSSVDDAVKAMKMGAYDYIQKPVDFDDLMITIDHALDLVRAEKEISRLKSNLLGHYRFENIIGESPTMLTLFNSMERLLDSPVNVLLEAESGTGKELVAKAIHFNGNRSAEPFIAVNCAAIPESLFESELFGHEKGAFTGALARHIGKFEQAQGGTIFLDEIGEMPLDVQARLLRIIQERELVRVGGKEVVKVDVRVIAATNRALSKLVEEKRFREDLFYRLSVFPLAIPPLRERKRDIPILAAHFLDKYKTELGLKKECTISPKAMEALVHYSWPGNVRELENTMQRAMILTDDGLIDIQQLPMEIQPTFDIGSHVDGPSIRITDTEQKELRPLESVEKDLLVAAIRFTDGNLSAAAAQLGLGRTTLYRKMKKYGLEDQHRR
jgi:DNA-binding NtrC family response regulator